MNKLKQFFGWLVLTNAYLASLSDDEVLRRAKVKRNPLSLRGWDYSIENSQRQTDRALPQLKAMREGAR